MKRLLPAAVVFLLPAALAAQALPEGDSGIASKYERDDGIATDPAVLFADDFEAVEGNRLDFGMGWDNVYGALRVTSESHDGAQAIEISHDGPGQSHGAWRDFGTDGVPTMFLRYYLKYHPQYPGCHHTGGGILAAAPGVDLGSSTGQVPDGTNHYTAFIDEIAPFFDWSPPGNEPPGFMYVYCYHMDQGSQYGDVFRPDGSISPNQRTFADHPDFTARPDVILQTDRWYHFEIMVQANTPGSDDGRIAFWIDGEVAGDFPGLRLRTADSLVPNVAIISTYTSEYLPNQTMFYDDVVVATSYVGPMVDAPIEPAADGGGTPLVDMASGSMPDSGTSETSPDTGDGPTSADLGSDAADAIQTGSADGCCATVGNRRPVLTLLLSMLLGLVARRRSARSC